MVSPLRRRQGCLLALRFQSRSVRLGRSEAVGGPGSRRPGRGAGALPSAWQRLGSAALLQHREHCWFSRACVSPSPARARTHRSPVGSPALPSFRFAPLLAGPQFSFPRVQEPTSKKPLAARRTGSSARQAVAASAGDLRVPLPAAAAKAFRGGR